MPVADGNRPIRLPSALVERRLQPSRLPTEPPRLPTGAHRHDRVDRVEHQTSEPEAVPPAQAHGRAGLESVSQPVRSSLHGGDKDVTSLATVLSEVSRIAPTLHKAGTFSTAVLEALVRHGSQTTVQRSAETGSGASTLLLLAHEPESYGVRRRLRNRQHSIDQKTLLFFAGKRSTVSFRGHDANHASTLHIRGLTPAGLDRWAARLSVSGPGVPSVISIPSHGCSGALLIVDDIHIPTVTNLFDF